MLGHVALHEERGPLGVEPGARCWAAAPGPARAGARDLAARDRVQVHHAVERVVGRPAAPPTAAARRGSCRGGTSRRSAGCRKGRGAREHARESSGGSGAGRNRRRPPRPAGIPSGRSSRPVAIVRRSAPIRFIEPSGTVDGPCRICSRVPIVPTWTRRPAGSRGGWPRSPSGKPRPGACAGAGQRGADHDRVGAERERLGDVAAAGHRPRRRSRARTVRRTRPGSRGGRPPRRRSRSPSDGHAQHRRGGVPDPPPKPTSTPAAPVRIRRSAAA